MPKSNALFPPQHLKKEIVPILSNFGMIDLEKGVKFWEFMSL